MDKNQIEHDIFRQLDVWKYQGKQIIRYRLLQSIKSAKYSVVGADTFKAPIDPENVQLFDRYFLEAISDAEGLCERKFSESIEEAIAVFEDEFL